MATSFSSIVVRYNSFGQQRYELETACLGGFGLARSLQVGEACDFVGNCSTVANAIDKGNWKQIESWSLEMRKKRESMK